MKENILVLLVDQWPHDCFGHKGAAITTPTVDRLASDGLVFNNAFTSCPLCSPARGTLFTGKWQTQSGMVDNMGIGYSQQEALDLGVDTWLDSAVEKGYVTGYYGKWHLGPDGPILRGIKNHPGSIENHFKPYVLGESIYNYDLWQEKYREQARELIQGRAPYYGTVNKSEDETNPFVVANQANDFIKSYAAQDRAEPFMLTVSINDPHFPHYLPEDFVKASLSEEVTLPENIHDDFEGKPWFHNKAWWPSMKVDGLEDQDWSEIIRYAYTHRMLTDKALGTILDTLDALNLYESTTIVFVSDHGDMCGAHNRFDKGPYFYDEVWRIPLIVKGSQIKSGTEASFVSILDVGATLFDYMGHKLAEDIMGRSLRPLMTLSSNETKEWNKVFGMYERYNGMSFKIRAVRDHNYKLVHNPQSIDELYDMVNDQAELNNLIDNPDYRDTKRSMSEALREWMISIDDPLLKEEDGYLEAGTIIPLGIAGP